MSEENGKITIEIEGMTCASCSGRVEKALNNMDGVENAKVNFAVEKAYVDYNADKVSYDELVKKIQATGYDVKKKEKDKKEVSLELEGMSCASCAARIETSLNKLDGVENAKVNYAAEKAFIVFDPDKVDLNKFKKTVEETGYSVKEKSFENTGEDENVKKEKTAKKHLILAWSLTIPVMVLMILHMAMGIHVPYMEYISLTLAIPVVFISGWHTIKTAFKVIFHFSANMDVLIMLGTLAAFATGILNVLGLRIASYAGVSAMIMSFHLTGRYIESRAKGKASQAIRKLLELGAKNARVIRDSVEVEIPVDELKTGDIMLVKPGEKIPTDGIIIEGKTQIDESMATGESLPVERKEGDNVIESTVNGKGFIKVKATKIGENTFLAQVAKLVEECQGTKVPIQDFADRVVKVFVPIVLVISGLTFLSWLVFPNALNNVIKWASSFLPWITPGLGKISLAVYAMVAVLVIACPCALGLATPTALMVGSGKGAENGILFRSGEAIQSLKEIKAIVFDKTGTITIGKPVVRDIHVNSIIDETVLLSIAASVENKSEHPLAGAVVSYAKENNVDIKDVTDFTAVTGKGAKAKLGGNIIYIGNSKLMKDFSIDISKFEEKASLIESKGRTVMFIARGKEMLGFISVADKVKDDSKDAISKLKELGIKTVMITGDNEKTARAIADEVGIDEVIAEVMPEDKVAGVKSLQDKYGMVAMVGDGINDAPALTQADVGLAIGTGTDIAIEASDVTIVQGKLTEVVKAFKLSGAIFKKIKQNLFWAFFYNLIAIPVAILGLLHPAIAEAAMAFSSVNVVTNSLRLKKVDLEK